MCFHHFQLIFMVFLDFFNKHEQNSWFQVMEFTEPIHVKAIRALMGAWHSWYSHQYCLLDIWLIVLPLCDIEIYSHLLLSKLVSHRGVLACYPGTLFLLSNSKILWMCRLSWAISMFDAIIDCLDACLIIFDKNVYYASYFQANLWCLVIALKKQSGYIP